MVAVARLAQVAEDAYDGDEHAEQHVDRVPEVVEVEGDGRREGARRLPVGLDLVELAEDGGCHRRDAPPRPRRMPVPKGCGSSV
eukprot:6588419-Prymnesium_polylepis.1